MKKEILMKGNSKGETGFNILCRNAREGNSLETLKYLIQLHEKLGLKKAIESKINPLNLAIMSSNTKGRVNQPKKIQNNYQKLPPKRQTLTNVSANPMKL